MPTSSTSRPAPTISPSSRSWPTRGPSTSSVRSDSETHAGQDQQRQLRKLFPDNGGQGAGDVGVCAATDGGEVGRVVGGSSSPFHSGCQLPDFRGLVALKDMPILGILTRRGYTERVRLHPAKPLRRPAPERAGSPRSRRWTQTTSTRP